MLFNLRDLKPKVGCFAVMRIVPGKGFSAALMPTTYGYFGPRLGVAWQAHPDTVIRAGFGLFTTPLEDAFYNQTWDAAPFSHNYNVSATSTPPIRFDDSWAGFAATCKATEA